MSILIQEQVQVWLPILFFVILYTVMKWNDKLPSTEAIQEFTATLNSRGGNILILTAGSIYFFRHAIYLFYKLLDLVQGGQLTPDNAYALMSLQFVTSTAFGGAFGALLKTMTGESSKARSTDSNGNGNGGTIVNLPVSPGTTSSATVSAPTKVGETQTNLSEVTVKTSAVDQAPPKGE